MYGWDQPFVPELKVTLRGASPLRGVPVSLMVRGCVGCAGALSSMKAEMVANETNVLVWRISLWTAFICWSTLWILASTFRVELMFVDWPRILRSEDCS